MENKQRIGVGRVTGGRIEYVSADGRGFRRNTTAAVAPVTMASAVSVERPVVSDELEVPAFLKARYAARMEAKQRTVVSNELDIPEFMKHRSTAPIIPVVEEVIEQDSKLVKTVKTAVKVYKAVDSFMFPYPKDWYKH